MSVRVHVLASLFTLSTLGCDSGTDQPATTDAQSETLTQPGQLGACQVTYTHVSGANGYHTDHAASASVGTRELSSGQVKLSVFSDPNNDSKLEIGFRGELEPKTVAAFNVVQRSVGVDASTGIANFLWRGNGSGTLELIRVGPEEGFLKRRATHFRLTGAALEPDTTTSATGTFTVDIDCELHITQG